MVVRREQQTSFCAGTAAAASEEVVSTAQWEEKPAGPDYNNGNRVMVEDILNCYVDLVQGIWKRTSCDSFSEKDISYVLSPGVDV